MSKHSMIHDTITALTKRKRLTLVVRRVLQGASLGLGLAIVLQWSAYASYPEHPFVFAVVLACAGACLAGVVQWLWPVHTSDVIAHVDRQFGLQQQLTTYCEYVQQDPHNPFLSLLGQKMAKALASVDPSQAFPLRYQRELATLLLLVPLLALSLRIAAPVGTLLFPASSDSVSTDNYLQHREGTTQEPGAKREPYRVDEQSGERQVLGSDESSEPARPGTIPPGRLAPLDELTERTIEQPRTPQEWQPYKDKPNGQADDEPVLAANDPEQNGEPEEENGQLGAIAPDGDPVDHSDADQDPAFALDGEQAEAEAEAEAEANNGGDEQHAAEQQPDGPQEYADAGEENALGDQDTAGSGFGDAPGGDPKQRDAPDVDHQFYLASLESVLDGDSYLAAYLEELYPPDGQEPGELSTRLLQYEIKLANRLVREGIPPKYRDQARDYFTLISQDARLE